VQQRPDLSMSLLLCIPLSMPLILISCQQNEIKQGNNKKRLAKQTKQKNRITNTEVLPYFPIDPVCSCILSLSLLFGCKVNDLLSNGRRTAIVVCAAIL